MNETNNYLSRSAARRKRRRTYVLLVASVAAFFLFCAGGSWLFTSSPLFHIEKIDITGESLVSRADVLDLLRAKILQGAWWKPLLGFENILVWPEKPVEAVDLIFYPAIKNIRVSKDYFKRTVSINVEERAPIGIWCYQGTRISADTVAALSSSSPRQSAYNPRESASSCWWFDDDGVVFRKSSATEGNLITVARDYSQKGGGLNSKVLPDRFMGNFLSIIAVMKKSGLDEKEILLKDLALQEVEVLTRAGLKLYFSLRFPADGALTAIENLEDMPGFKNLQYIDFRVENKAYFKL